MEVNINYTSTKNFPIDKLGWWAFYFNMYTYIKGFNLRILGVHFNIRENNGTEKMIKSFRKK